VIVLTLKLGTELRNSWLIDLHTSGRTWTGQFQVCKFEAQEFRELPHFGFRLDSFEHGKLNRGKLISQHNDIYDSFVWLLTRLQGARTALAKRETIFVNYILLGLINSNSRSKLFKSQLHYNVSYHEWIFDDTYHSLWFLPILNC
jgi:hypothetical protein